MQTRNEVFASRHEYTFGREAMFDKLIIPPVYIMTDISIHNTHYKWENDWFPVPLKFN